MGAEVGTYSTREGNYRKDIERKTRWPRDGIVSERKWMC